MKVLVVGYSSIARRRVLPALAKMGVTSIDLASRSAADVTWPAGAAGVFYSDYEDALRNSSADLVYISTLNHLHAPLAELSLRQGRHTVVDKPAFLSVADADRLAGLALGRGLCLAEATVYPFHPQIAAVQKVFAESNSRPERLSAVFSFPPLPADNFRHRAEFGGGCLWDLGPYAMTPGRIFFKERPEEIICRITHWRYSVDVGFSFLMIYSGGRSLTGQYGYTTGYRNCLEVLGPGVAVTMDRAFTTPPEAGVSLRVSQQARQEMMEIGKADTFALFLNAVRQAIAERDFETWPKILVEDAYVLDQLRQASGIRS